MRLYMQDVDRWVDALCGQTDPDAFFPKKGDSVIDPKTICAKCPFSELADGTCLDAALLVDPEDDHGIWGGISRQARKIIREDPSKRAYYAEQLRVVAQRRTRVPQNFMAPVAQESVAA